MSPGRQETLKAGANDDKALDPKLASEAEGLLAVLCWAAKLWHEHPGITLPARVSAASKGYLDSNNPLAVFEQTWCETSDLKAKTAPTELYDHYTQWHARFGEDGEELLSITKFGAEVAKRYRKRGRPPKWYGIRVLRADELAAKGLGGDDGD